MFLKFLKKNIVKTVLGYTVALLLGISVTLSIIALTKPDPWMPLGPYPEQRIIAEPAHMVDSEKRENIIIPATSLSKGSIWVNGTKCSKESVAVQGASGWRSTYPGGFQYNVPPGPPGRRSSGCQTFTFENEIPPQVKEWAGKLLAAGEQPEMYLSGCEIPLHEKDGTKGTEVCWKTEVFAFIK